MRDFFTTEIFNDILVNALLLYGWTSAVYNFHQIHSTFGFKQLLQPFCIFLIEISIYSLIQNMRLAMEIHKLDHRCLVCKISFYYIPLLHSNSCFDSILRWYLYTQSMFWPNTKQLSQHKRAGGCSQHWCSEIPSPLYFSHRCLSTSC